MSLLRNLFRARERHEPAEGGAVDDGRPESETSVSGPSEDQFDALMQQVAKLGREQFQTNTLLEAQNESLDELNHAWRDEFSRREQQALEARRALSELEGQLRLSLAKDLLPIADALAESIRSARELAERSSRGRDQEVVQGGQDRRTSGWSFRPWRRRSPPALPPPAPAPPVPALEAWLQGMSLVERRVLALLEREGVRPIPALGRPFDPERHLAVATEPAPAWRASLDGTVIGETLRGYTAGGRVLRYAEVVVARGAANNQLPASGLGGGAADGGGLKDE